MGTEKDLLTALIPAYNEKNTIQATIQAIKTSGMVDQIIVINDCSHDDTSRLAKEAGAEVLDLPRNLGKGGALNCGLKIAKGNIIVLLDADLGKTASEVSKLIEPIRSNKADLSIGRFPSAQKKGGFGFVTKLAKKGIRGYTGLEVSSPLSGQRVMRREVLEQIGPFESGFGVEVGMTIDAFRHGFRVKEVPVMMGHTETGRNLAGFIHRGQQFWDVALVLLSRLFVKR